MKAPGFGEVDDEGGGFHCWSGFVNDDHALARVEPGEALPVGSAMGSGGLGGDVDEVARNPALRVEALEPVMLEGWLVGGILGTDEGEETPIIAEARPKHVRSPEALGCRPFSSRYGNLKFEGCDGIAQADAAGAAFGGKVVDEHEGEERGAFAA